MIPRRLPRVVYRDRSSGSGFGWFAALAIIGAFVALVGVGMIVNRYEVQARFHAADRRLRDIIEAEVGTRLTDFHYDQALRYFERAKDSVGFIDRDLEPSDARRYMGFLRALFDLDAARRAEELAKERVAGATALLVFGFGTIGIGLLLRGRNK